MHHTNVTIRALLEADARIRAFQRKVAAGTEEDRLRYVQALEQVYGSLENYIDEQWKDDYEALKKLCKDNGWAAGREWRKPRQIGYTVTMPFIVDHIPYASGMWPVKVWAHYPALDDILVRGNTTARFIVSTNLRMQHTEEGRIFAKSVESSVTKLFIGRGLKNR